MLAMKGSRFSECRIQTRFWEQFRIETISPIKNNACAFLFRSIAAEGPDHAEEGFKSKKVDGGGIILQVNRAKGVSEGYDKFAQLTAYFAVRPSRLESRECPGYTSKA